MQCIVIEFSSSSAIITLNVQVVQTSVLHLAGVNGLTIILFLLLLCIKVLFSHCLTEEEIDCF